MLCCFGVIIINDDAEGDDDDSSASLSLFYDVPLTSSRCQRDIVRPVVERR